jgi:hypothetical protein
MDVDLGTSQLDGQGRFVYDLHRAFAHPFDVKCTI